MAACSLRSSLRDAAMTGIMSVCTPTWRANTPCYRTHIALLSRNENAKNPFHNPYVTAYAPLKERKTK